MDLHNGLDIEVYDLRPTDLHYYYLYDIISVFLSVRLSLVLNTKFNENTV